MSTFQMPDDLAEGGRTLWVGVVDRHQLDGGELAILLEACRAKDRLDRLDEVIRPDPRAALAAMSEARATTISMLRLLAALRLPDPRTGRRPQYRGPRGVYRPRNV